MTLRLNKYESLLTKDAFCQVSYGFGGLPIARAKKDNSGSHFHAGMRIATIAEKIEKPALAGKIIIFFLQ